jgi:hypothetical protein
MNVHVSFDLYNMILFDAVDVHCTFILRNHISTASKCGSEFLFFYCPHFTPIMKISTRKIIAIRQFQQDKSIIYGTCTNRES